MRDRWKSRWGWRVSAVVLVGGSLGTRVVTADDGKDGKNASTNHTLRWDTDNPPATRFTMAFPGAVLDKNTGLVGEQAPDATVRPWQGTGVPYGATGYCVNKNVGRTVGWRLPSLVELKSVQDHTLPGPYVPGTVFTGVQSASYWSATTDASLSSSAWYVSFYNGGVFVTDKSTNNQVWCVRGPMNADTYGGFDHLRPFEDGGVPGAGVLGPLDHRTTESRQLVYERFHTMPWP